MTSFPDTGPGRGSSCRWRRTRNSAPSAASSSAATTIDLKLFLINRGELGSRPNRIVKEGALLPFCLCSGGRSHRYRIVVGVARRAVSIAKWIGRGPQESFEAQVAQAVGVDVPRDIL